MLFGRDFEQAVAAYFPREDAANLHYSERGCHRGGWEVGGCDPLDRVSRTNRPNSVTTGTVGFTVK